MKRWPLFLTTTGIVLLVAWGMLRLSRFASNAENSVAPIQHVNKADAMDSQSGWRYRQNMPHHWRYIMLQK